MYQKFRECVKEYEMLNEQDKVIVGVSGGADSICLLFMLSELKKELGFSIVAVHVHHGLRGESADADALYVEKFCDEKEIELLIYYEDAWVYAKEYNCTLEEAGRELRRNIFGRVLKEKGATKIALAHHKNDNVETFLLNLCRGTGMTGLGGMRPVMGEYIRPFLAMTRQEIEAYLDNVGISYRVDETNLTDDYTRNRLRNRVIPYLEENINVQTVEHIAKTMKKIQLFNEYVEKEVGKYVKSCVVQKQGKYVLKKSDYNEVPEVFRKNILYEFLAKAAGRKKDLEDVHVQMIEELLGKQVGRKYNLPYGLVASRVYEGIELSCAREIENECAEPSVKMQVFERTVEMETFPEKTYTKWFDYDIIKNTVEIRHREPGDYIVIDKKGRTQKLKQYFINEKIPQNIRDDIWLVADGQQIMWIVGYRQSQAYQITDKTTKIVEICFEGRSIE